MEAGIWECSGCGETYAEAVDALECQSEHDRAEYNRLAATANRQGMILARKIA